jgi:preprotein translocase subunit SecY
MFGTLRNVFKIPDLRNKLLFTIGLLALYRIGFHIPLAGVDQHAMSQAAKSSQGTGLGQLAEYFALFTGGDLQQSTIFGLGIMPYISASIIFQLLATVVPALEKLQREGDTGRKKIQEYTRYATVGLCLIQAMFWVNYMRSRGLVLDDYRNNILFVLMGLLGLTTGTILLMWLGEQIDEYGIGNGISLIIMAGIIARMPRAIIGVVQLANLQMGGATTGTEMDPPKILFLIFAFIGVVAGAILITQGQRRIPIQQAKHTRGRRVYGGQRQYLPLRVNHGGVMPIIFASSLMLFPSIIFDYLRGIFRYNITAGFWQFLAEAFSPGQYLYEITYIGMIFFFAYFWTTVQFQPKEMANNLRDYGSFIPGRRPGKRTADYLETVMTRITYVGAAFLAIIAVIPSVVAIWLEIPYGISAFLGGTGLLIVVSVALDLVQRIEAELVKRNYQGFLGEEGGRIKGAYA